MSFRFVQNSSQTTRPICTGTNFRRGYCTTPPINLLEEKNPDNVHEVPVLDSLIHGGGASGFSRRQLEITNCQVNPPQEDVLSVKPSGKVESAPENRVTKSKRSTCVLQVLAVQEQYTQTNSGCQMQTNRFHVSSVYSVFSSISCKIAPQQKLSISFGQPKHFYRNNTKGRPAHTDLNSRHQCPVQEPPQLSYKKHSFAPNKQHHTKMQSSFHFSSVETENTFTTYIAPPQGRSIRQAQKCKNTNSGSTCVLVKHQYHRSSQPQKTQPSQNRPRTRINQMIPMMGPTSSMASGCGTLVPGPTRPPVPSGPGAYAPVPFVRTNHQIFVILNFQSHWNKK